MKDFRAERNENKDNVDFILKELSNKIPQLQTANRRNELYLKEKYPDSLVQHAKIVTLCGGYCLIFTEVYTCNNWIPEQSNIGILVFSSLPCLSFKEKWTGI